MPTIDPTTPTGQMPNGKTGGYTLVMSDEFNSTTLDSKWHNNHDFADNSATSAWDVNAGGNSCLRMWWNGNTATDNQMMSSTGANPFRTRYGFFEARIKMIQGKGFFGGWWLYPYSNTQQENGDGTQQELDITEWFSYENGDHLVDTTNYQSKNAVFTIWTEGGGGATSQAGSLNLGGTGGYVPTLSTAFHTYAMEWSPTIGLQFYFDGVKRGAPITDPWGAANNIQLAVFLQLWWGPNGGNPTPTNGPTTIGSGQSMQWDYVRIWSIGGSPSPAPAPAPSPTPTPTPTPTPSPVPPPANTLTTAQQLYNDMTQPHSTPLFGVPSSFGWDAAPLRQTEVNFLGYEAPCLVPWGLVGMSRTALTQANNTRVQVRNFTVDIKRNGVWSRLDTTTQHIGGALYTDWATNTSIPANTRAEASGGISVKMPNSGGVFHFFVDNTRFPCAQAGLQKVITRFETRYVKDNAAGVDDSGLANLEVGTGCDVYRNMSAQWAGNNVNNAGMDIGRCVYISNNLLDRSAHNFTSTAECVEYLTYAQLTPAPSPPPPMTAALTSATFADGQTINGLAYFRVDGDSIQNCELLALSAGTYTPMYGRFTLAPGIGGSASRACTLNWDTTTISNGPLVCHISAFSQPPGSAGTEIVVAQFHYIINNVAPSPISISATASAGPLNLDMQFVTSELDMLSRYIKTGKK